MEGGAARRSRGSCRRENRWSRESDSDLDLESFFSSSTLSFSLLRAKSKPKSKHSSLPLRYSLLKHCAQKTKNNKKEKGVERGVDLLVVLGEIEDLERLQLAYTRRDSAEAAALEVEVSQRPQLPELCREPHVLGSVP